ncbi:MAG TPA: DUF2484 family protein [Paracoccus sp. (in: a-proteobacteria)]|nr:DUF2484 family protein [Paracoccus sp. (in: a-proteobacteria)]
MVGGSPLLCLAAALLWMLGVSLMGLLRPGQRPRAQAVAVIAGVPLLGWLTYDCGPVVGGGAFALGLTLLAWCPVQRRRRGAGVPLRRME